MVKVLECLQEVYHSIQERKSITKANIETVLLHRNDCMIV